MNRLKELRTNANLTQEELCKNTKIRRSALSDIENGKQPFREIHIRKLCAFFGVTPNYLLGIDSVVADTPSREHIIGAIITKVMALNDVELASVYKLIK